MKPTLLSCLIISAGMAATAVPLSAVAAAPDPGVVLINPFEVKPGQEAECLAMWKRAAAFLKVKPGFRSTVLHKNLSSESRFLFVNVAVWDSPQAFRAAVADPAFQNLSRSDACTASPSLYQSVKVKWQP